MEATTASSTVVESTGSQTIADLLPKAAEKYADKVAVKFKDKGSGEWQDVTFRQVGEIVSEIGRGLIDLGIKPGDRVSLLCNTRAEWTYADFGISTVGAVVVPIYPTNSPEECEWVAGNSDSVAIFCEDATQVAKIRTCRRSSTSSSWRRAATRATRSRSTSCASAAAGGTRARCSSGRRRSSPTTRTPSSIRRAPRGRRRAAS
jgi:long-subunit acyl-CoA synthetase (AMP-forming)